MEVKNMQERCDMKEIQKMLGSFSCPELAELSALATKYKMNFADLGIKRDLIDPKLKDNLEEISKVMRLWRENIDFQSLEKTIETFKTNNFFESPEYSALIKKMEEIAKPGAALQKYWKGALDTIQEVALHNPNAVADYLESVGKEFDCSVIQEEISFSEEEIEHISSEEFAGIFKEQLENPKGFQERVANWTEEKKKEYYILWKVFSIVFHIIYGVALIPWLQSLVNPR
ncbi:hypothetical protein [Anaerotignum faecicola]|uniref:hypothetical protein n=2 Tax=Anaerotignum faecicola TaxID=2358141 RepID=UPI00206C1EA7|nr:MAG TPA: hypothetical protein [Caudoviricetes sp.]